MEEFLRSGAGYVALGMETTAVLLIAIGGIETGVRCLILAARRNVSHGLRREVWLNLARWLLLGLEFTLGADVVRSAIAPSWNQIGQLAAIALIRTFLNLFLERDIARELVPKEINIQEAA
jgi:uncharacterized membrane protein